MPNRLLVIIDPQKDFISADGNYAQRHRGITQILDAKKNIIELTSPFREKIVAVLSDYTEDQFEKGLSICIPGTEGHKIDMEISAPHTIISKNQHSSFSSLAFNDYLKDNNIDQLILCGFLAEYCVKQTALDALQRGYKVTLLEDCIGTGDDVQYRKEEMLELLKTTSAEIITYNSH